MHGEAWTSKFADIPCHLIVYIACHAPQKRGSLLPLTLCTGPLSCARKAISSSAHSQSQT